MTQQVRVFGLSVSPLCFGVVTGCFFIFSLTAGGAWLPIVKPGSGPLAILFSAQAVSFALLTGSAQFLYAGVQSWKPAWKSNAVFFNAALLGIYVGNQILPLLA